VAKTTTKGTKFIRVPKHTRGGKTVREHVRSTPNQCTTPKKKT